MRYPPHILDEIRARIPVSTVVGRKVRLKKAGREWKGLSPFNAEKTPSFYANDQKAFYHDFSSGKHGDIFTFLMETEGLSFPEAVERLASEAGVELPRAEYSADQERVVEERRGLHEVLDLACRFFEGQLAGAAGAAARDYLDTRRILPSTQAEFRIGYAPDSRNALLEHLRGKGVEDDLVLRAGLAIKPEDGRGLYDRFRGRIVFPIQDRNGKVVAFGGRAMADGQQPKYLNSPETEIFSKGQMVFNGHRARAAARKAQPLAVVEGYVDAIAAYQAGHKAVVATLGTAFTEEQVKTLWRLDPEPVLCFDGDRAGRAAAFRALDRMMPFLEVGRTFRFAFLPEGQDPDDVIRAGGIEAFQTPLRDAQRFWDVLWARETETLDAANPDAVARLQAELRRLIGEIGDTQLRYRYELTAKLSVNELAWRATRKRFKEPQSAGPKLVLLRSSRLFAGEGTRQTNIERIFLGLCIAFPDFAAQTLDDISRIRFRGTLRLQDGTEQPFQPFADILFHLIHDDPDLTSEIVAERIGPAFYEMLEALYGSLEGEKASGHALAAAFPPFGQVRDPAYFSRCFEDFRTRLFVREMEDQLQDWLSDLMAAESGGDAIADVERIAALQAEIHRWREWSNAEENELAEIAEAYRPKAAA